MPKNFKLDTDGFLVDSKGDRISVGEGDGAEEIAGEVTNHNQEGRDLTQRVSGHHDCRRR